MKQALPPPPYAETVDAVEPLDYAPPVARSRVATLIGGLLISVVYSFSGGMIAFGLMLGMRNDREAPIFFAIGVSSAILATGMWITVWLARR